MADLTLLFLPQWSPFQPPLSLPSLAAWLRRAGYDIECIDANILFYQWLLSRDCAETALQLVDTCHVPDSEKEALRATLQCSSEFRRDLAALRSAPAKAWQDKSTILLAHYTAMRSLETYLLAVSVASGNFFITPYEFRLAEGNHSASLEAFANAPSPLVAQFMRRIIAPLLSRSSSRIVGLSCIGQEQLPFALLFGRTIKQTTASQVIVGGTIFSRIFERGILRRDWMADYFDVVVRNEGEKPCEAMLRNAAAGAPLTQGVPGIVYRSADGMIHATAPAPPLRPDEVPIPDFDDLPLHDYISAETTLPVLASRGCYWGKCEFCHHFMVYGDKYTAYPVSDVAETVRRLSARYHCRRFAFNDEAVPPKIVAALGRELPDHSDSGFTFTGLIKFEKYYTAEHFANLARVGFRSLYIGLESASERVLALMKKPNSIATIVRNLRDATDAGIWTHCFLFFGFPGETESDAKTTFDFVINHSDIIGSFGCGSFSLEHNAPIQKHPSDFGVTVSSQDNDVSVYYDYSVQRGLTARRAEEWSRSLRKASQLISKYRMVQWVPREFLLCLISYFTFRELTEECAKLESARGVPPLAISDLVSMPEGHAAEGSLIVNRMNGKVARVNGRLLQGLSYCLQNKVSVQDLLSLNTTLDEFLAVATFEMNEEATRIAGDNLDPANAGRLSPLISAT
jgi:anaerobic magnesium-protoporphyrin IX monomethyl ester cyclase